MAHLSLETSRFFVAAILAATLTAPVGAADTASITGKVTFIGENPKIENIRFSADPYCEKMHAEKPVPRQDVIINPNDTLKNVIVHVKDGIPAGRTFPTPSQPAVVNQLGCLYTPHALGVMVGQTIEIRNSDATMHNVNGRGAEKQNKPFNFSMVNEKVPTREVKFDKPELPVRLKCDVHPWMVAHIGVFSHPFFSVTGDDGTFKISDLPAGKYTIEAWHEQYGRTEMEVTVGEGEAKTADFTAARTGLKASQ